MPINASWHTIQSARLKVMNFQVRIEPICLFKILAIRQRGIGGYNEELRLDYQ